MTGAVLIDVRADAIRISGQPVTLEELATIAAGHVARTPERLFIVRPQQGVPLQQAVTVLDSLNIAGVTRMSLSGGAAR